MKSRSYQICTIVKSGRKSDPTLYSDHIPKGPFKNDVTGGGGFAESVSNGDKGGLGLLVGGDGTTVKKN